MVKFFLLLGSRLSGSEVVREIGSHIYLSTFAVRIVK